MSISLAIDDGIATIRLERVQKNNAISLSMWQGIVADLEKIKQAQAKVLVIRGATQVFSAGADLAELAALKSKEEGLVYWSAIKNAVRAIDEIEIATIALIEGYCIGGGCRLALSCDLRFAAPTAKFSLPEAKWGILPDASSIARVVALVGPSAASELFYTGSIKTAEQALRIGLVNEVIEEHLLDEHVAQVAKSIAANDVGAIRQIKEHMRQKQLQPGRHMPFGNTHDRKRSTGEEDERIVASMLATKLKDKIRQLLNIEKPPGRL